MGQISPEHSLWNNFISLCSYLSQNTNKGKALLQAVPHKHSQFCLYRMSVHKPIWNLWGVHQTTTTLLLLPQVWKPGEESCQACRLQQPQPVKKSQRLCQVFSSTIAQFNHSPSWDRLWWTIPMVQSGVQWWSWRLVHQVPRNQKTWPSLEIKMQQKHQATPITIFQPFRLC